MAHYHFFLEIPFLNILLGIGVILLEGYIFLWKIPWLLYKGTGFKKKYYPILPITSLISFVLLFPKFVPSHHAPTLKDYQKEASTLLSSNLKASQAFFIENRKLATSTKDIGLYISIYGCQTTENWLEIFISERFSYSGSACNQAQMIDYSNSEFTRWYSPSGNYKIEMKSVNDQNIFVATPTWKLKKKGLGVSGCFNSKTGKTKILEMDTKGTNIEIANCDD